MNEAASRPFRPSWWLRNAHVQTIGSSLFTRVATLPGSERRVLTTTEGVQLEVFVHKADTGKAGARRKHRVILLHGWLGSADSTYILATAQDLLQAGHDVVRLNLRDHGQTAHLNEEMFHSARTREVVDACVQLADEAEAQGLPTALIGYSLGGNFALRVCSHTHLPALAICPAIDPAASCVAIDSGTPVYRRYFLRKWYRALAAKAAAFPERYDFHAAANKPTIIELTEVFIGNHLPYPSSSEYFNAYRIYPEALAERPAYIIAARDDPVCPWQSVEELGDTASVLLTEQGGHCGYIPRDWMTEQQLRFLDR